MRLTMRAATLLAAIGLLAAWPASVAGASSQVRLVPILSGYSRPVLVTHAPGDGRVIFIVEQTGRIMRATYEAGTWRKLGTFLDLRSLVIDPNDGGGEQGLLGLAFHPGYADNGLLLRQLHASRQWRRARRHGHRRVPAGVRGPGRPVITTGGADHRPAVRQSQRRSPRLRP